VVVGQFLLPGVPSLPGSLRSEAPVCAGRGESALGIDAMRLHDQLLLWWRLLMGVVPVLEDVLAGLGFVSLVVGVYLIYVPAALVVAGLLLLGAAWLYGGRRS